MDKFQKKKIMSVSHIPCVGHTAEINWCITPSVQLVIRLIFCTHTLDSERYSGQILAPSSENLSDEEREYGFFQQYGATPIQPIIRQPT
jgi:hypothetical protein